MAGLRDDYLMRQLERLAHLVAAVLQKIGVLKRADALAEIHQAYQQLFQIEPRFAHLVDPATLGERGELFKRLRDAERSLLDRREASTPR